MRCRTSNGTPGATGAESIRTCRRPRRVRPTSLPERARDADPDRDMRRAYPGSPARRLRMLPDRRRCESCGDYVRRPTSSELPIIIRPVCRCRRFPFGPGSLPRAHLRHGLLAAFAIATMVSPASTEPGNQLRQLGVHVSCRTSSNDADPAATASSRPLCLRHASGMQPPFPTGHAERASEARD